MSYLRLHYRYNTGVILGNNPLLVIGGLVRPRRGRYQKYVEFCEDSPCAPLLCLQASFSNLSVDTGIILVESPLATRCSPVTTFPRYSEGVLSLIE